MSTDIATAAEFHLTGWYEKNKRQLAWGVGIVAVVALVLGFYLWNRNQRESDASKALSNLTPGQAAAQDYLKMSDQYSGTAAAGRAVLLAASSSFTEGRYAEAQAQFTQFLSEQPESPSRPAALLGVAACLAAQGKAAEAMQKYQDVVQRFPNDQVTSPAKSALARLYEAQNQFKEALPIYQDLARSEANQSYGLEAMVRLQDLLARHPELANASAAPVPVTK
jgi:TolA-binding protein